MGQELFGLEQAFGAVGIPAPALAVEAAVDVDFDVFPDGHPPGVDGVIGVDEKLQLEGVSFLAMVITSHRTNTSRTRFSTVSRCCPDS